MSFSPLRAWGPSGKRHLLCPFWYLQADSVTLKFCFSALKSHSTSSIAPLSFCSPTTESFSSFLDLFQLFLSSFCTCGGQKKGAGSGEGPSLAFHMLTAQLDPDLPSRRAAHSSGSCPLRPRGLHSLSKSSQVLGPLVPVGFFAFLYSLIAYT